jgi:hypothetical protein
LSEADNLRESHRPPLSEMSAISGASAAEELDEPIHSRTARLLGELQDAVTGMQTCVQQLSQRSATRDRVALQLLSVEAARAEWLLRARQYLEPTRPIARVRVRGAELIDDVNRVAGSAIGLRGGTLQTHAARGASFTAIA